MMVNKMPRNNKIYCFFFKLRVREAFLLMHSPGHYDRFGYIL